MLKNTLSELLDKVQTGGGKECKICRIVSDQDPETRGLIIEAFQSGASTMSLVRALKSENINLSREYLAEKRKVCFKSPNSTCHLMNQQNESK